MYRVCIALGGSWSRLSRRCWSEGSFGNESEAIPGNSRTGDKKIELKVVFFDVLFAEREEVGS